MPTQTLSATMYSRPAKRLHAGVNVTSFDMAFGATAFGTIGDAILLGKIPTGAKIVRCAGRVKSKAAGATAVEILVGSTTLVDTITASETGGWLSFTENGKIVRVSLSDDAALRFSDLVLRIRAGSAETASFNIQGSCQYVMDN